MKYKLELKQIVDFPRCRIYRNFIQDLIKDKKLRTNGSSYLFYFILLCSYANYRTSSQRYDGIKYNISAGEWICRLSELQQSFRCRFQHQTISILDYLQKQNYITYCQLGRKKLIKFQIIDWKKDNTSLNYSYPCQKDAGFFFFPINKVHELISIGKASEIDILLDLWIHAIYQDSKVEGSDIGPVVYFRDNTGNPLTNYTELSARWGISKSSVCRVLNKLENLGHLSLVSFKGNLGTTIYLENYLSTMFNISDSMIDKEEVSLNVNLPITIPSDLVEENMSISSKKIIVPENTDSVPESHIKFMVGKVAELLDIQGIPCCSCPQANYQLSKLSDCKENLYDSYTLKLSCPEGNSMYHFEIVIHKEHHQMSTDLFNTVPSLSITKKGAYPYVK
jgi:hypothetical protein